MANSIKYSTGSESLALKKGNFYIGTGDVGKGPTSSTGYYNGITPPSGGYTIYLNKESGGPSIYTVSDDTQLISLTNSIAGTSYTTANECLVYFASQNDKVCLNRDYEGIITDGLVLNLDAGFTPSYPKNGTTWYDISTNINNVTLTNGPTFTNNKINFDGTDDYVDFYSPNLTSTITVEIWINLGSNYNRKMIMGWNQHTIWSINNGIGFNTYQSDVYGLTSTQVTSLGLVGNWNMYTLIFNSGISYTNNKIYINASQQSLTQVNSSQSISNTNFNNGYGRISGARYENTNYRMPMDVGVFKIYNRELTQEEITQNYNAQKGRFGL